MKLTTAKELGALARQARKDNKWTQQQLSERVGVSRDWIIRFEQGKGTVELALVLRTLKALQLAVFVRPNEIRTSGEGAIDLNKILREHDGPR